MKPEYDMYEARDAVLSLDRKRILYIEKPLQPNVGDVVLDNNWFNSSIGGDLAVLVSYWAQRNTGLIDTSWLNGKRLAFVADKLSDEPDLILPELIARTYSSAPALIAVISARNVNVAMKYDIIVASDQHCADNRQIMSATEFMGRSLMLVDDYGIINWS